MQPTVAYQLTIFTFGAATFMMWLVVAILTLSMFRIMRINRLELAYASVYAEQPAVQSRPAQEKTEPATLRKTLLKRAASAAVDINITPDDSTVTEKRYQPSPMTRSKTA